MTQLPLPLIAITIAGTLISSGDDTLFTKMSPQDTGIDHRHDWVTPTKDWPAINSYAPMTGAALADYDSDGKLDLFMGDQQNGGNLYRNLGNFKFEKTTAKAGLKLKGRWTTGTTFADINNDGHPDLFIAGYKQPNLVYLNNGDGTFTDHSAASGLNFSGATTMAVFGDHDRDGDLDCYLLTNKLPAVPGTKVDAQLVDGKYVLPEDAAEFKNIVYYKDDAYKIVDSGQRDYFFENDGKGNFTDVTKKLGLYGATAPGLSATWWDMNNDQWPDLYVANDFYLSDQFWKNENGKKFTELHKGTFPHQPWFSMGSDFGDLNGDGHFDYLATDMSPNSHFRSKLTMGDMSADSWFLDHADPPQYMRNSVYINGGNGQFMELAQMLGLSSTNWTWAIRACDLDCDGRLDLFYSTGMTKDFENSDLNNELEAILAPYPKDQYKLRSKVSMKFWKDLPSQKEDNFAFRNLGDLNFENKTLEWGLQEKEVSSGVAIGDLDNDGDPDLIVMNYDDTPSIYRNNTKSKRLKVRLDGTKSNKDGVGARLILTRPDGSQDHRFISLARGFLSSSGPEEIFGLGDQTGKSSLRILWPSGQEQTVTGITPDQTLTISEKDAGPATDEPITPAHKPLFASSNLLDRFAHLENTDFDEFLEEPLLPQRVSQLGPGLALGDLNRDGRDDLVLSGSAGNATLIAYMTKNGLGSIPESQASLSAFAQHEDLAPLIFDADRDGDLDLFIASGGTETKQGDALQRDRLFLNDGKGKLSVASSEALPDLRFSAGPVAAADFDHDGDLDLFLGGRTNPGAFPTSPRSAILRNDSEPGKPKFTDITNEVAPGLMEPGMITSALWTDATGDGWSDLLLTLDWGPVTLFVNNGGKSFTNQTKEAGLSKHLGWFTSISGGDIDHDGDIDYVAGNFGRNTKYHPKEKTPTRIYYGDFDDSGKGQIVEAKVKDGCILPVRGKSCSQNAMPFIRSKFPTYQSFAIQELEDIYPESKLENSLTFEANTLDSVILRNDGNGKFTITSLPKLAQASPVFGSTLTDLNGDSHLDLAIAQNFYGPQRETGRFNGGLGLILLGDGKGDFEPLWPDLSGFSIKGDATALVVTDLDQDQSPDLVVATNNGPTYAFTNQASDASFRTLNIQGPAGNPTGVGAKITYHYSDQKTATTEITCGGGYLSQSSATQFVSIPQGTTLSKIDIQWPGRPSQSMTPPATGPISISSQSP